jgi:hypothetical protein
MRSGPAKKAVRVGCRAAFINGFTADRVCSDILAVADAVRTDPDVVTPIVAEFLGSVLA